MTEMRYSVSELDALRRVVDNKWLWGTYGNYIQAGGSRQSRCYNSEERTKAVEELVRTHMLAGHKAEDLIAGEQPSNNTEIDNG